MIMSNADNTYEATLILNTLMGVASSLLYLLGVMRAQKVLKITRRVRYFDKYRSEIGKSIASLEKNGSE